MSSQPELKRPSFEEAMSAWKTLLSQRGFSTEITWLFEENLCFEKDPAAPGGFRLGYQTRFAPPPPEADRIAFDYFSEQSARLVVYRLGSSQGKSLCLLLCDEWFEAKGEVEGYLRKDEWQMSFYPGSGGELQEVTDEARWKARILRDRPLHDLDFSMTLQAVHEALAHGRVLTAYEHYALRFLHLWRRMLGNH